MSIPERFARIARHKLNELKDRIEQWDEEAEDRESQRERSRDDKEEARRELDSALDEPRAFAPKPAPAEPRSAIPVTPPARPRTPEEIARGYRSATSSSGNAPPPVSPPAAGNAAPTDPLLYHYRLLGVEPGADFSEVQAAYNKYAARSDPGRFAAGSEEARQAEQIRQKLEASYRVLREALDITSRRFDMLEFDDV